MTTLLGKFSKQTDEILDYYVDYSEWFADRADTPQSIAVTSEAGLTVVSSAIVGLTVKIVVSGGTNGSTYKVTCKLTTTSGIVREADFTITIKDV